MLDTVNQPVTGAEDDALSPWAMQVVVYPASLREHFSAIESVASAVLLLLDKAETCEAVRSSVQKWEMGRIRKIVRRAKTESDWNRALECPLVSGQYGKEVRASAFAPTPVNAVPKGISRLQVSGLDLPRRTNEDQCATLKIMLTPHVRMTTGKAAAQAAHSAHLAYKAMEADNIQAWRETNFSLQVFETSPHSWKKGLETARVVVCDAGFTEVPEGTVTSIAYWE